MKTRMITSISKKVFDKKNRKSKKEGVNDVNKNHKWKFMFFLA